MDTAQTDLMAGDTGRRRRDVRCYRIKIIPRICASDGDAVFSFQFSVLFFTFCLQGIGPVTDVAAGFDDTLLIGPKSGKAGGLPIIRKVGNHHRKLRGFRSRDRFIVESDPGF